MPTDGNPRIPSLSPLAAPAQGVQFPHVAGVYPEMSLTADAPAALANWGAPFKSFAIPLPAMARAAHAPDR